MAFVQMLSLALFGLLAFSSANGDIASHGLTRLGVRSLRGFEDSIYFTSQIPTTWHNAMFTCTQVLGNNASLVSIETQEEMEHIQELLAAGSNNMTTFWAEGKYEEKGRKIFSWGMGQKVQDSIWAETEPSQTGNGIQVALKKNGNGTWSAYSIPAAENHGYICEITPGSAAVPVPCYNTNDLIIALDSSGSIGAADYKLAKEEFVLNVSDAWEGFGQGADAVTRQSFLIYSNDVQIIFRLDTPLDIFEIAKEIIKAPYIGSGTASHLGLQKSFEEFRFFERRVTRNLVFLTDGQSNSPELTKEQANNLHAAGIRVFAVGIGSGVNKQELEDIASDAEKYVFHTSSFAELKQLLKPITGMVCDDSEV